MFCGFVRQGEFFDLGLVGVVLGEYFVVVRGVGDLLLVFCFVGLFDKESFLIWGWWVSFLVSIWLVVLWLI